MDGYLVSIVTLVPVAITVSLHASNMVLNMELDLYPTVNLWLFKPSLVGAQ